MRRFRGSLTLAVAALPHLALAAVVLDGTLGPAGPLVPSPDYAIGAELGSRLGPNLFHSFRTFGVEAGRAAVFSGPDTVANIIARVTGGEVSAIDGTLRSTIAGADLFLLNPSGIVFGFDATLDLKGALHASSADSIRLGTDGWFSATSPVDSVLSAAPPAAFGFLGTTAGAIRSSAYLRVEPGQAVSLVGGDLRLEGGYLVAPDGTVALASVRAPGELPLDLHSAPQAGMFAGSIELIDSVVDTSGTGGGRVFIRGGELVVRDSAIQVVAHGDAPAGLIDLGATGTLAVDGSTLVLAETAGAAPGAAIRLDAGSVRLADSADIKSVVRQGGAGGSISIHADTLAVDDGAVVKSSTSGDGAGGAIRIEAATLTMRGAADGSVYPVVGSIVEEGQVGSGRGGDVTVSVDDLLLEEGAWLVTATSGSGRAGDIGVSAASVALRGGRTALSSHTLSDRAGSGAAGNVTVSAGRMEMDDAVVDNVSAGWADGGAISVSAGDLTLTGDSYIGSIAAASGHAGAVGVVVSRSLDLDGADTRIFSAAQSKQADAGHAGDVAVAAGAVRLTGGARVGSWATGPGSAGSVHLDSAGAVDISGAGSGIYAHNAVTDTGSGATGDIGVTAASLSLADGAAISTNTYGGSDGGDILVAVAGAVTLRGVGADPAHTWTQIRANSNSALADAGDGGDITIRAGSLHLAEGGEVTATTYGPGDGGDIRVEAGRVTIEGAASYRGDSFLSGLFALSQTEAADGGDGGTITVRTADLWVSRAAAISASTGGGGDAGAIDVVTDTLTLSEGGRISASAYEAGDGGVISVVANDSLRIAGTASGIFAATSSKVPGGGVGGPMIVRTADLEMTGGANISSSTFGSGAAGDLRIEAGRMLLSGTDGDNRATGIYSSSFLPDGAVPSGDAGDITVLAREGELRLEGGAVISATTAGAGHGGDLRVDARDITLAGSGPDGKRSGFFSNAVGSGDAGDIVVAAGAGLTATDAAITARAAAAGGGNVTLDARRILLDGTAVTASVGQGGGSGGNVTVRAERLVARHDSDLTARADQGHGGRISVDAALFLREVGVDLDASSNVVGNQGTVEVNAPAVDPEADLAVLPSALLDVSNWLNHPCRAPAARRSSFVLGAPGALPSGCR